MSETQIGKAQQHAADLVHFGSHLLVAPTTGSSFLLSVSFRLDLSGVWLSRGRVLSHSFDGLVGLLLDLLKTALVRNTYGRSLRHSHYR